jgi:hypothetical protein
VEQPEQGAGPESVYAQSTHMHAGNMESANVAYTECARLPEAQILLTSTILGCGMSEAERRREEGWRPAVQHAHVGKNVSHM